MPASYQGQPPTFAAIGGNTPVLEDAPASSRAAASNGTCPEAVAAAVVAGAPVAQEQ